MSDRHGFICPWVGWSFVKLLGHGTYGDVSLFEREEYGNTFYSAIKHIPIPTHSTELRDAELEGVDPQDYCYQLVTSLLHEININVELRGHTNFVSYDDLKIVKRNGELGYDIYIKMEFLANLNEYLRIKPLTLADAIRLCEDICTALSVVQKRNLIHGDIKPENIFVNKDGNFKLGDFGIVRVLDTSVTRMSVRDTQMFTPPEVARNEKSDYRVDLYSLGLVLYKLMNRNRVPFLPAYPKPVTHFEYATAQDMRLRGAPLPRPAYDDVVFSNIILKACEYDRDQRWSNAIEMKETLLAYSRSLSIQAKQTIVLDINEKPTPPDRGKDGGARLQPASVMKNDETDTPEESSPIAPDQTAPREDHFRWFMRVIISCIVVVGCIIISRFLTTSPQNTPNISTTPSDSGPSYGPISETPPETPSPPEPFVFHDAAIEATIRQLLDRETGDIYPIELDDITELSVQNGLVESLEDLTALRRLITLRLTDQPLSDASLLGELTELEVLNVSGCQLTDATFVASLTGLIRLDISRNDLSDIHFASELTHLEYLNISNNGVTDLTPLSNLTELQTLDAKDVPVDDWSAVQHIPVVYGAPEPEPPATPPSPPPSPSPSPTPSPRPSRSPSPSPRPSRSPSPSPSRSPSPTPTPTPSPSPSPSPTPTPTPIPTPIPVDSVSLSSSNKILQIGEKYKLTATVSPSNATNKTLTWSSSNPSVATVDGQGNVSAVGQGTASITVTCGNRKATCAIAVS